MIAQLIKYFFTGKIDGKKVNKYISVTENGGFGMSSENIFKDKEKSLEQLANLKKSIKKHKINLKNLHSK